MDILLLDFDHTLYPSTLATLEHVDRRINLFIRTHLGLEEGEADAMRRSLCAAQGTTLRGLIAAHGVDPHAYCDFIHDIDDAVLPPPDPGLRTWLQALGMPAYLFTNARADWAERCLKGMDLWDLVGEKAPLLGILDLPFTGWMGKPHASAYADVEAFILARHGAEARLHLVDDRLDNLATAARRGWRTSWVKPHHHAGVQGADGHDSVASPPQGTLVLDSLLELDPGRLRKR